MPPAICPLARYSELSAPIYLSPDEMPLVMSPGKVLETFCPLLVTGIRNSTSVYCHTRENMFYSEAAEDLVENTNRRGEINRVSINDYW